MEEDIIRQHDTGTNPFRTPDGYFDTFTSRLMERMEREGVLTTTTPDNSATAKVVKMNPFKRLAHYAAAAVVAGVCIGAGTYLYTHRTTTEQAATGDPFELAFTDETLDEALDYEMEYEMVDNKQIALYLTEAY